jgi:NAD(P)-dependent dehydrogenase (short-subunit alcohol dehydrogenase family)
MNILITGSEGGLGSHLSQRMKSLGHNVCGMDIQGRPDVLHTGMWTDLLGKIWERLRGQPDAVVLCAGATVMAPTESHSFTGFISVMDINLIQPFRMITQCVGTAARPMRFVAIGSASAHQAMSRSHGYVASKAGLEALMRCFARDCTGRLKHLFFTISPGAIAETGMTRRAIQDALDRDDLGLECAGDAIKYLSRNPLGRMATKDEVCDVIEFCLFKAPEACSGTTFKMPMASGVE